MVDQMRPPLVVEAHRKSLHHHDRLIRRTNRSAQASEVIAPASNAATTSRPSAGENPNKSLLHRPRTAARWDNEPLGQEPRRTTRPFRSHLVGQGAGAGGSIRLPGEPAYASFRVYVPRARCTEASMRAGKDFETDSSAWTRDPGRNPAISFNRHEYWRI
jgi:hypothetical protein